MLHKLEFIKTKRYQKIKISLLHRLEFIKEMFPVTTKTEKGNFLILKTKGISDLNNSSLLPETIFSLTL
jgi:hypothetical protein